MLDLTWWVREKIFKRPRLEQKNIAWEELSEKQTTKLWYFLLILMFIAIITSAQWTLNIIHNMVKAPTNIPYCVEKLENVLEYGDRYNSYSDNIYNRSCNTISLNNPKFDFSNEYEKLKEPYLKIKELNKYISNINDNIRRIDYNYRENKENYKVSLLEKIANEDSKVFKRKIIQKDLETYNGEISKYESQKNEIKRKINFILEDNKSTILRLHDKIKRAYHDYRIAYLWYKFKIALLSFIFIWLVFWILYNIYVKSKRKNSPYSIIFSVAVFSYWLVFLEIFFSFVWDLIPHRFLAWLWDLLDNFKPLLYLVQFLYPLIIIWIFWFIVYKIQKRLYSKENILKRFISDKKCPQCWNSVDITKPFCPLCQYKIQIKCEECWKLTVKWMPYCSNCWKKTETN